MGFGSVRSRAAWPAALLIYFVARAAAAAEAHDAAAAEALFEEAKQLFGHGDYEGACPKFAESYRLDPATGVLFALALCHERNGKLASAWAEFIDTAARAHAEQNTEREAAARERAGALLPRLAYLVVRVDPATDKLMGLEIKEDNVALRPAAFGSPLPVDPGPHLVRAEAPGHEPWQATIDVPAEPGRQTITVPALEPSRSKPVVLATPAAMTPATTPASERHGPFELTPWRLGAIALGGAGIASLGIGGGALVRALDEKAHSARGCGTEGCTPVAQNERAVAHEAATWATVGAVSGVALLGAGALAWVLGRPASPQAHGRHVTLLLGPGHAAIAGEL